MVTIQTGRDPFNRWTVRKRIVHLAACTWCGQSRGEENNRYAWQYYLDADSTRDSGDIKGRFCGIGCLNSYHS